MQHSHRRVHELDPRAWAKPPQGYNNIALSGKAAIIVFLLQAKIRSAADLKTMTVDDQRNT
jgi:hypothetical protein